MATQVITRLSPNEPVTHTVSESAADVADEVNDALTRNQRFIMLTDESSGKEFSVVAAEVKDIRGA